MIRNIFSVNYRNWCLFGNNLLSINLNRNSNLKYLIKKNKIRFNSSLKMNSEMSKSLVNILIVFNTNGSELSSKQSLYLFNSMKTSIESLIGRHKYTIYNMSSEDLQLSNSWHLSTAFVIAIGEQLTHHFNRFNRFNGTHITFKINDLLINDNFNNNNELEFNFDYFKRQMSTHFNIDYEKHLNNSLNQLSFDEINESNIYLITKDRNDLSFIQSHKHCLESKIRLIDEKCGVSQNSSSNETPNESKIDLIINADLEKISFDTKTYFSNLKTTRIGHWFAFEDITSTTMSLIEPFFGIDGFVAIANQQTKGRGRNQNEWLSPKGCAMFTAQLSISLNSNIGQKLGFIQHLAALSVIKAINTIPGYEDIEVVVKWPNDIFCNKTKSKLSGILVTSLLCGNKVNVLIGCGINVSNRKPSLCLNDVIDNYNKDSLTKKLNYVTSEEVIARTLTQFEMLLSVFEQKNGIEVIKELYVKHWMHDRECIKLNDNEVERVVTITGLDSDGYLQVRDNSNGSLLSLHPDGNRFDMLYNLTISGVKQ